MIDMTDEERALAAKHNLDLGQIKWRRLKKLELRGLFGQEYPEDPVTCFLTSGNGYFGDISGVFTAPLDATYQDGHRYSAGLDWGQENDFSSLTILDDTARCQVDRLHINRLEWKEIRKRVKDTLDKWRMTSLVAEKNSIGSVNIEALQELGISVYAFETTNESKSRIMSAWYEALHSGWQLQDWDTMKNEHRNFVSKQLPSGVWQLAAAGDGHDDTVMSGALAYEHGHGGYSWTVY